jgi:hypothetical protein
MDARLRYTRDEIMSSHDYVRPHEQAGYRLHGGFVADGSYVSPRTRLRWPAVRAWGAALEARGWPLIDATGDLLKRQGYPTFEQQKLLLKEGFGQTLWNSLTITGIIEARGQALCNVTAPDMQMLIVDDVSDCATGHMNAGLLYAHGADEGGDPAKPGEGAHDQMWFAARDLVFGKNAYPLPEPPASIARPVEGREMPDLPEGFEQLLKFLMNVLMIEIRAESFFALCCAIFREPELFAGRRADAETAAVMVERIRTDEAVHVGYLQVLISEMRSFQWKTKQGLVRGADIIDPVWARMVAWHGDEEREIAAARTRAGIEAQVTAARGEAAAKAFMTRLDALDDKVAAA